MLRNDVFRLAMTVAVGLVLPASAARGQDSTATKPPAAGTGVYTDEQAERGNAVFSRVCVECHNRKDMASADFRLVWNGRTVFDLFDRIRTTMPEAAPGSMSREEYADVTAYFLKLNGLPTGSMPMPADSTLRNHKLDIPLPPAGSSLVLHRRLPAPTGFSLFHRGY